MAFPASCWVVVSNPRSWKNAIAGQIRMDLEPGRIGYMSTQRRENRWQRTSCTERARASGTLPTWIAPQGRAFATDGTAPPRTAACFHPSDKSPSPGAPEWLATNSLQSDHLTVQLAVQDYRRGSPPSGAGRHAESGRPAAFRSSLPHLPAPPVFEPLHLLLPQFPADKCRWTERYDGKRDLHLQHAA